MISTMQMQLFYESRKTIIIYSILSWLIQEQAKTSLNAIKSIQQHKEEESTQDEVYKDLIYRLVAHLNTIHR